MTAPDTHRALLPVADAGRTWAALRALVRPHRAGALAAFAVLLVGTGAGLLTQPLLGRIVDAVAAHRTGALTFPVVGLALAALVQAAGVAVGLSLIARFSEGMLATLRERFVERALRLPLERVERAGAGDLTSRVTRDGVVVAEAVRRALPLLARSSLTIVLTLVAMAVLDWRFLLAALVAVPIQVHGVRWYARRAVPLYAAQRVAVGAQQQQLLDTVDSAATVRALRLAGEHLEHVERRSAAAMDLSLDGIRLLSRLNGRLDLARFVSLGCVLAAGFLLVRDGSVTVGTATAAALYMHGLFNPVNTALSVVDDAQAAASSLARMVGVAEQPLPAEPECARPHGGTLAATGLGHAYLPGHDVLHDVGLTLEPGECVALVGASGAGKSTLAALLAGVHRPSRGTVTLGGVRLDELGDEAVHRAIVLITQDVHVFAGPLADDLRLARPEADEDELRAALEVVGALEWAERLPDGLATVVGDGGHRLTVAQAQQLALARVVVADRPVVILDEATAEAGSAGARLLEDAVAKALAGRAALVVAHRLTQAAAADRILVLDAGRVVESGTHGQLLAASGRYAELWRAWSAARDRGDGQE